MRFEKKLTLFIYAVACLIVTVFSINSYAKGQEQQEVVVYTSLDQVFSEPILKVFEKKTGIKVRAVYDSEATKTTGLVNRLIAEKPYPRADVFWNSEIGRTIVLKRKGVLDKYVSPSASDIPDRFKDKDNYWTGFAARCRVLIYNTNLIKPDELPKSIFELTDPKWKDSVSIAYPLFGTTAIHTAAIFDHLGEERAKQYFQALKDNGIKITDGNASSRDRVADGTVAIGFTDTDDAFVAIKQGRPVDILWPDNDGIGTLLIPNTVALIKAGPNAENGKKFIDFLLSPTVEKMLAFADSRQIPLRDYVWRPEMVPDLNQVKAMEIDYEKASSLMESTSRYFQELFVR